MQPSLAIHERIFGNFARSGMCMYQQQAQGYLQIVFNPVMDLFQQPLFFGNQALQ